MAKMMTAAIVILWGAACASGFDLPEFPFLCTGGQATIQVSPDIATISFYISHSDANSVKGLEALREKSRDIVDLMREFSIAREDGKASDIRKHEVYEDGTIMQPGEVIGYGFSRQFTFRLQNLDSCRKITQKLLEINHVTGVNTEFGVIDRKAKEDELMQQAIANAHQRAQDIARGAGAKVVNVYALSEVDMRTLERHFLNPSVEPRGVITAGRSRANARAGGLPGADDVIAAMSKPPMITLQASIRVLYRIEPGDLPSTR